ncbi:MAG: HNH endonuclease [Chloroflexi bacterium]|nr:HNH endonuclease [Chloroflexota bacterium]
MTGDHVRPRAFGGTNDAANVRVLCRRCNSRRGAGRKSGAHGP